MLPDCYILPGMATLSVHRLPAALHEELRAIAAARRMTLRQVVITALQREAQAFRQAQPPAARRRAAASDQAESRVPDR
jgi:hypothetical protein